MLALIIKNKSLTPYVLTIVLMGSFVGVYCLLSNSTYNLGQVQTEDETNVRAQQRSEEHTSELQSRRSYR
jgi:hypothetical protein